MPPQENSGSADPSSSHPPTDDSPPSPVGVGDTGEDIGDAAAAAAPAGTLPSSISQESVDSHHVSRTQETKGFVFGVATVSAPESKSSSSPQFPTLYSGGSAVSSPHAAATTPTPRVVLPQTVAEEAVQQFVAQFKHNFRDGTLTAAYRTRAASLNTGGSSSASPSAVSPAVSGCPVFAATGEAAAPPQVFTFPWTRLSKFLWEDALADVAASSGSTKSRETTNNKRFHGMTSSYPSEEPAAAVAPPVIHLSDDFSSYDALCGALECASAKLATQTPTVLDSFCIDLNRTYINRLGRLADALVRPCLADTMADRVLPRMRGADWSKEELDAILTPAVGAADQERGSHCCHAVLRSLLASTDASNQRDVQCGVLKLLSGIEELCLAWVACTIPWLTQLCRGQKERTPLIFQEASAPHNRHHHNNNNNNSSSGEEAPALSVTLSRERVYTVVSTIAHAAKKVYLTSSSSSSSSAAGGEPSPPEMYRRAVLIPSTWIGAFEDWVAIAMAKVNGVSGYPYEAQVPPPPPLNTWKLIVYDESSADWVLCPRKQSQMVSQDCGVDVLPEPLFNALYDIVGGGVKLLATDVPCTSTMQRLASLPIPSTPVRVYLAAAVVRCLQEECHVNEPTTSTTTRGVTTTAAPLLAALPVVPLHASLGDTITLAGASFKRRREAATTMLSADDVLLRDLSSDAINVLVRCLTYGHYDFTTSRPDRFCFLDPLSLAVHALQDQATQNPSQLPDAGNEEGGGVRITITRLHTTSSNTFGDRGLDNLGNTCFMNSGLQCLSNIPRFRRSMLEAHASTEAPPSAIPLTFQFVQLLRDLWRAEENSQALTNKSTRYQGSSSVCPVVFKDALGAKCSRFSGYEQQDTIELVEVLLDRLHDELNPVAGKKFRERRDDDADIPVHVLSKLYWDDFLKNNNSVITRLFYRQERTRFGCMVCGHKATVFDAQSSLPVPVGEERYISLDVVVVLNPLDSAALFSPQLPSSSSPDGDRGVASSGACANEEEEGQDNEAAFSSRAPTAVYPADTTPCADTVDRLHIRVRVPLDSSNSVVLSEVRRTMEEAGYVTKDDAKTILLVKQSYAGSPFLSMAVPIVSPSSTSSSLHQQVGAHLQIGDAKKFTAVVAPSIRILDPPPNASVNESAGGEGIHHPQSASAAFPKMMPTAKLMFVLRDLSGEPPPVDGCATDGIPTFVQFSIVPKQDVTNRDLWRWSRRVFERFTVVVAAPSTPREVSCERCEEAHTTTTTTTTTLTEDGDDVHGAPVEMFTVALQLGGYHTAPETNIPMNNETPPGLLTLSEHIIGRVIITFNSRAAGAEATTPEEENTLRCRRVVAPSRSLMHDTLRTVISNEEAEQQRHRDGGLTLEKALSNMRETHVLKGDDAWYCPKCKTHCESTTEAANYLLPEVLTIHLKRFKTTVYGTMNKIDTTVQFPLELDMGPFVAEDAPRDATALLSARASIIVEEDARGGAPTISPPRYQRQKIPYELTGVVYHSGSLSFGHYTAQAFCEGADAWVYYNDSSAYKARGRPPAENAYILFYQRVDPDAPPRPASYFGENDSRRSAACEEKTLSTSRALVPMAPKATAPDADDLYHDSPN